MAVGMCVIRINIARFFWKHLLAKDWILKAIYYIDFSRMRGTTTDAGSNHYYFNVNFIPPPADAPYGTVTDSDSPASSIDVFGLAAFTSRCVSPSRRAGFRGLPVPIHEASPHAEGLRPRRLPSGLTMSPSGLLPSASLNSVGSRVLCISWLNTSPMVSPVNASKRPSRTVPHDSGLA
jgi:hypothetical protein